MNLLETILLKVMAVLENLTSIESISSYWRFVVFESVISLRVCFWGVGFKGTSCDCIACYKQGLLGIT
jgi:hypothetical protein